jgi:hypothetical protein
MELVFMMLPLLFFVYAFAAVCSGLKESRSAMFALRISSIYVLLHYLRQMLLTGIHNVTLIVIGVLVIFVYKLFFSSGLRVLFPKESRRLDALGWIGILLYSLPLILLITVGIQYIDARRFSKPVDVGSLNLHCQVYAVSTKLCRIACRNDNAGVFQRLRYRRNACYQ